MTLAVDAHGSGPDLVMLHGWGSSAAVWNDVATLLAPRFRLHCPDLPGSGANPKAGSLTLDTMTDALALALPQHVTVCGWSLGGQIALDWALRHPHQVARLILIASTPRFVNGGQWMSGLDTAVLDGFARALDEDCTAVLRRFAALQARGDVAASTVRRKLHECATKPGLHETTALAAGLRILRDTDLRDSLSRVTQPALIVHGARDAVVPLAAAECLAHDLPRAKLEVFESSGHAPHISGVQRVARHVAEFCRE